MDTTLLSKDIGDGWRIEFWQMLFNLRLVVTDGGGVDKAYCYHIDELAYKAFEEWNGEGDPYGWFKDPHTGRYQNEFGRQSEGINSKKVT